MRTIRGAIAGCGSLFLTLLFFIQPAAGASAGQAAAAATLTNDDVIKMVQAKLSDAVVVTTIKSSSCKFDTSPGTLIKLKQAGVSDAVLEAMAGGGSATKAEDRSAIPPGGTPPDPNDPQAEHDPGIYYVRQNPGGRQMTPLDPTAYSGGKSGGTFTSAMTYGIKKAKWKAEVRGRRANVRITEGTPTFYFYFEQKHGSLSYSGGPVSLFGGLSTPNQFTLIRLEAKKDSREVVVGEFNAFGTSTGTRNKDVVDFDYQKAAPGIYKVTPKTNLEPGEYCFFYTGQNTAMGQGGGSLFDFGVNPAQ